MDEKDPWVLLSRPAEWDDAMVEQGFGPRACERRARKTNYILLGTAVSGRSGLPASLAAASTAALRR